MTQSWCESRRVDNRGLITQMITLVMAFMIVINITGCTTDTAPNEEGASDAPETTGGGTEAPPGSGETQTQSFELGDCLATLDCDAVDLTEYGVSVELNACLDRSCVARTDGTGMTCRFSFTGECLETTPEGDIGCMTNRDCNDNNACTNDVCVGSECVRLISTDPAAGTAPQCQQRSCNTTTGTWGNISANEGGACNDGDTCTNSSVCMAGTCVGSVDPDDVICCDTAVDCAGNSCPMGQDPTCSVPLGESGIGRCGCDLFWENSCYDGADGPDGDGLIDCADPDCADEDICNAERGSCCTADTTAGCNDTTGQNYICTQYGGGDEYCCEGRWDSVCVMKYKDSFPGVCVTPVAEVCNDGIDNDLDTFIDCADPNCSTFASCIVPPPAEICNNSIDDDLDSFVDCADPNCSAFPACVVTPPPTWLTHPAGSGILCWAINPAASGRIPSGMPVQATPVVPSAFQALCTAGGQCVEDILCIVGTPNGSGGYNYGTSSRPFLASQTLTSYLDAAHTATFGNGTGYSSRTQICSAVPACATP